jgi:hypothetical protein
MKYRVWCDPDYNKGEREDRDGEDHNADSPREAVVRFAENRYRYLQHIDPGVFLVRAEDGTLTRWSVVVEALFVPKMMAPPEAIGR